MANYAYLRVSGDTQDVNNQKHGILEYSNRLGLSNLVFVEDCVSGAKKWRQRRLGGLLAIYICSDMELPSRKELRNITHKKSIITR